MNSITMTHGKARNQGGAIYLGGTGSSSITFSNCAANVEYFDSKLDGGFLYIFNPEANLLSSNCCYEHIYAFRYGGLVYGSH